MQKIGIIGPGESLCSRELYSFGQRLGGAIAAPDRIFVCGGLGGFMEAVCKGIKQSPKSFAGQTVGILPGENAEAANPYIDLPIPTGIGEARNLLIVRTADILVAGGGGAGTLSELAFAWQFGKKVLCVDLFEGWARNLGDKDLDARQKKLLIKVNSIGEIMEHLDNSL